MTPAEWARRLWYLLNRRRFEAATRAEMEAHRDAMGDPRPFGSVLRHREAAADVWGWRWLDDAVHDARFAWRTLRRAPGVSLVIVITLALATGATTAIFGVVNGGRIPSTVRSRRPTSKRTGAADRSRRSPATPSVPCTSPAPTASSA